MDTGNKMSAEEALNHFLSGALQKQYKDRYRSLIQTKKGKQKFLSNLWHQFEDKINESKTVKEFPSKVWTLPAYSFSENNGFGQKEYSMQNAFESVGDGV